MASVDRVRCRRISLARKTIRCSQRVKRESVIAEVEHLQRLRHSHVVQVIGTYVIGNYLSILLYPATEYNLETFMDSIFDEEETSVEKDRLARLYLLPSFFLCLATALDHIHQNVTKHMDIKPQNLLVRDIRQSRAIPPKDGFKIYVADFGIAKAYQSVADAETDSPTACTIKYSAPEVVAQKMRGLSADIFSLGCVYTEMLAVIASNGSADKRQELKSLRESNISSSTSYQANVPMIVAWMNNLNLNESRMHILRTETIKMLSSEPELRPSATNLVNAFSLLRKFYDCRCDDGPDLLESGPGHPA